MKKLILCLIATAQFSFATEDFQGVVYMPLIMNDEIIVKPIPATIGYASPETEFSAITHAYIPLKISPNSLKPEDINAASISKISLLPNFIEQNTYSITIDLKNATSLNLKLISALVESCYRTASNNLSLKFSIANDKEFPNAQNWLKQALIVHAPDSELVFYRDLEEGDFLTRYFIYTNKSNKVTRVKSVWAGDSKSKPMVYVYNLDQTQITITRSNANSEYLESLLKNESPKLNLLSKYTLTRNPETHEWELTDNKKKISSIHHQQLKTLFSILQGDRQPFVVGEAP